MGEAAEAAMVEAEAQAIDPSRARTTRSVLIQRKRSF
jgi:hypothetical protein